MAREPIIDAHTHIYRTREIGYQAMSSLNPNIAWNGTPEELRPCMAAAGIVRSVGLVVTPTREMREKAYASLPTDLSADERRQREAEIDRQMLGRMERNNRWGSTIGREYPEILPFINIDPVLMHANTIRQTIREMAALGAKGIKLLPMQHQVHGNDPRLWPVYETAAELGLPVLSQSGRGGAISPTTGDHWGRPRYFAEPARASPTVRFILAHLGSGYEADVIDLTRRFANVYADTSTVPSRVRNGQMSREDLAGLVRRIGIGHVLFGTNWPLYDPRADIAVIESLPLTEAEKRAILFENAAALLGVSEKELAKEPRARG
jgi:predicted TIM-barrel fold metal-dependent hydrolase